MHSIENLLAITPMVKVFRECMLSDPDRPGYHFAIPEALGQPGDPNGAFYADGCYHLMYLYRHEQLGFCWGHLSSIDLLHWRHHPDALVTGSNSRGCFSGGAFVDDDNKAYISFWDYIDTQEDHGGLRIAVSDFPPYEKWEISSDYSVYCNISKGVGSVTSATGVESIIAVSDPSNIWKKNGIYYMQAGNLLVLDQYGRGGNTPINMRGDWTDLFCSSDLKKWHYLHRFYQRDASNCWTDETEDDMCPSFLPLPHSKDGGPPSDKYLQLFISHNKGCQYYIGTYDSENDLFIPEKHGRMSWVDCTYFAPEALIDHHGRQIMWAWLRDDPADSKQRGWSGVFGMLRVLWLDPGDGNLCMAPAPEFQRLRFNAKEFEPVTLENGHIVLDGINGLSCELDMKIDVSAVEKVGIRLRTSDDIKEYTDICYDPVKGELSFDSRQGTTLGWPALETAPLQLRVGELLCLTVFIDKSVIEVYANEQQAICRRVYPVQQGQGIQLFCSGKANFNQIQTWQMAPSNPY